MIQNLPPLEIEFLRLIKQFGSLIDNFEQFMQLTLIIGSGPEFDKTSLCLRVIPDYPRNHRLDRGACLAATRIIKIISQFIDRMHSIIILKCYIEIPYQACVEPAV